MIRAALPAALLPALLLGCNTDRTELLRKPWCPTKIDVFGGADVLLPGTGGPNQVPRDPTRGFESGAAGFDKTLAGRLQAALLADAEITRRFGTSIRVRACAAPLASLSTFTRAVVSEPCQNDPPNPGGQADACTFDPAPVALVVASEMGDRCHGGELSPQSDMPAAYADHVALRLSSFLAERRALGPVFTFIGPQSHWEPQPVGMGVPMPPDALLCQWRIPHWSRLGVMAWGAAHADATDVRLVGDLLDEFVARDPVCCGARGVACVANDPWMTPRDGTPLLVNEGGAQAIAKRWVDAVKGWMLEGVFRCN